MKEPKPAAEILDNKDLLQRYLASFGITIPKEPDERRTAPRQWLVRSERHFNHLNQHSTFIPQAGEHGLKGVYFADSLESTMFSEKSVFYIYPSSITSQWLDLTSERFKTFYQEVAKEHHLNTSKIGDGFAALEYVYERYPTYRPKDGVCTIPFPLSVQDAQKIIVPDNLPNREFVSKLPKKLLGKVSFIRFNT